MIRLKHEYVMFKDKNIRYEGYGGATSDGPDSDKIEKYLNDRIKWGWKLISLSDRDHNGFEPGTAMSCVWGIEE